MVEISYEASACTAPLTYCITMTPLIIVSCVNTVYNVNVRGQKWWKSHIMSSIYIVSLSCWPTLRKTVCMPLVQSGLAANIWEYSFSSIEQISNISSDRSNTTDPGGNYLRFSLDPMSKYFLQITLLVEIIWNLKNKKVWFVLKMRINLLCFELVFVCKLPFSHFHIMSKAMLSSAAYL